MNQSNEWRNAFGKADRQFEETVYGTLMQLDRKEGRKGIGRTGIRVAIALACLLLMTTAALAAANSLGLMDFLNRQASEGGILPEATTIITKAPEQTQMVQATPAGMAIHPATFAVRETIFDGQYAYVVVEVKPSSQDIFLVGVDMLLEDAILNLGPLFEGRSESVREYAASNGQSNLLKANVYEEMTENGEGFLHSIDYKMEEDGTLVYMLSGAYTGDAAAYPVNLICSLIPYTDPAVGDTLDLSKAYETKLSLTLTSGVEEESVRSVEPIEFADCGVRVDAITLTKSPMATYVKVEFTITDPAAYAATDDGLWFEFLDAQGNLLPDGAPTSASVSQVAGSDTQFVQKSSIGAAAQLPESITIRGYNCWEKNRYSAHTVEMK